jgi:hypothetical protein
MKRSAWPPYRLVEESIADRAERKLDRLERLYHVGQNKVWDGRAVLADLIAKHGPPRLPDDARRDATLRILSLLLWGELAAWAISADLAEQIEDVEAKMAATSQAHDEARHFYVLRDYLRALGHPVPRLGGIGRRLLISILETPSLVHKLVGMQLLVESNALGIFRGLAKAHVEPVLTELLPYYEQDEARHVGLGVLYLPRLLKQLDAIETAKVMGFQLRSMFLLISGGLTYQDDFETLGLDAREMSKHTTKLQDEIMRDMLAEGGPAGRGGARRRAAVRGLLNPTRGIGPKMIDFLHPPEGRASATGWHGVGLRTWTRVARFADRALARVDGTLAS